MGVGVGERVAKGMEDEVGVDAAAAAYVSGVVWVV